MKVSHRRPARGDRSFLRRIAALTFALSVTVATSGSSDVDLPDTGGRAAPAPQSNLSTGEPVAANLSASATPPAHDLQHGQEIFTVHCLDCHNAGVKGAPRLDDIASWRGRIAQGLDVLIGHALQGHGRMPPKGGFTALSDTDVAAAVAYVYDRGRQIIDAPVRGELNVQCAPVGAETRCSPGELESVMLLRMLWLLGGAQSTN